ncbi:uncharacterized protein [Hemitrygon akajei]|uniref:uncharacterized protein isoform X2 n=1 Tax=Hemitrygon akajei TaxID=2704970 RepID=UPI003BFA312E
MKCLVKMRIFEMPSKKQGVKREDIRVVILLEKCLDKVYKPEEVAHQGMFDANTVVVRILWEQLRWNSPVQIQESLSNKEAMDKVKRSINKRHVQCYGRGDVHEKIVKELKICQCEGPGVPCVLFVYKVSHEIQDLRNALQWVTEKQGVKREDIGVVILLEKCWDKVYKPEEVAHQGMFDANTVVVRILWEQLWWNSSDKVQQSHSNKEAMDKVKRSISKCQVQCYGRGDVHEMIVKELHISPCEGPGVPCLLFVYEVSCQDEDLRNALQWVTEKQGVKREDISVVILLEKCWDKVYKPEEVAHQGMFDANTVVVRILWKQQWWNSPVKIRKSLSNKEAMDKVKRSISKCQDFSKDGCFHQIMMDERNMETLRNFLANYKPPKSGMDSINILLFSLRGSEELSVIIAFFSALYGHSSTSTDVLMGDSTDFPEQLRSYRAGKITFWGTSGWNAPENIDRTKRVLCMILEGRVPAGTDLHRFNPDSDVDEYPVIPENVIHGVAFVSDISSEDPISDDTMNQLKELHAAVAQKSIYSIVIGTKFEQSGIQENDHERIYEYWPLQEKFKKLSESTGMEMRSMFVISNQLSHWNERTKCILALYTLNNMVRNIDKYLKVMM